MDFNGVANLGTISLVHCSLTLSAGAVLRGGFSVVSLVSYRMDVCVSSFPLSNIIFQWPF